MMESLNISIFWHFLQRLLKTTSENTVPVLSISPRDLFSHWYFPLIFCPFQRLQRLQRPSCIIITILGLSFYPIKLTRAQRVSTQHQSFLCCSQGVAQRLIYRYKFIVTRRSNKGPQTLPLEFLVQLDNSCSFIM